MALTSKETALRADYTRERKTLRERIIFLDKVLALFAEQDGVAAQDAEPQLNLAPTVEVNEDEEMHTIRGQIRRIIRAAGTADAPTIARMLVDDGVYPEYKKAKVNVNSHIKRMRAAHEIVRVDDGWRLAS